MLTVLLWRINVQIISQFENAKCKNINRDLIIPWMFLKVVIEKIN